MLFHPALLASERPRNSYDVVIVLGAWLRVYIHKLSPGNVNVLEREIRFNLGLNAAKSADYIRKTLQGKVVQNKISYKKLSRRIPLTPTPCSRAKGKGIQRFTIF